VGQWEGNTDQPRAAACNRVMVDAVEFDHHFYGLE